MWRQAGYNNVASLAAVPGHSGEVERAAKAGFNIPSSLESRWRAHPEQALDV